ncbi:MAG: hypothetical protein OEY18_03325 [Candidatus Aminicenantes bacterium]|nr:hypothetical protein [Candidatus Aminicenantes bacterium]MDH5743638.1 hypothetical protein [Candidatus Aminicenantes bacterium]
MNMATFPQILFSLWESKSTGRLLIPKKTKHKILCLKEGDIFVCKETFEEKSFLDYLTKKSLLDSSTAKKYSDRSAKTKTSLITFLLDLEFLSPTQLWKTMETFAKEEIFPLFDLFPIEPSFTAEGALQDSSLLVSIPTLSFIRDGIYQMQNFKIIDAHIPQEAEDIQKLTPDHSDQIRLEPFEDYLIRMIEEKSDLRDLYSSSPLGIKLTKKAIFALFCLGMIGSSPMATPNKPLQEFSVAELHKILDTFNAKCSYIFKYVSKELGPVALNLLEKSIEDTKPYLSPHLQKIRLLMDGKIELQSVLKSNIIIPERKTRQRLIKSLNEILAAEILAVKKTLGNDSESTLIKNLEKIGA